MIDVNSIRPEIHPLIRQYIEKKHQAKLYRLENFAASIFWKIKGTCYASKDWCCPIYYNVNGIVFFDKKYNEKETLQYIKLLAFL